MAHVITTTTERIIQKVIADKFVQQKVAIVKQQTIYEKAILTLYQHLESYMTHHLPDYYYNGAAEIAIFYPLFAYLLENFFLIEDKDKDYKPGVITSLIRDRGADYAAAVGALNLATTKFGVKTAVDINDFMFHSATPRKKQDLTIAMKDFIWSLLNVNTERTALLNRIKKSVDMPHPKAIDINSVGTISALMSLGRGEALSPSDYPFHQLLRTFVLSIIKEMIDYALKSRRQEVFLDVLNAVCLFVIYINITESDHVYDTALPPLPVTGNDGVIHSRRIGIFKTLSMIFNRVGFAGSVFNANAAAALLKEVFEFFPDLLKTTVYTMPKFNDDGTININMDKLSYVKEVSARYEEAVTTCKTILPPMFAGCIEDVMAEVKKQTSAKVLLPHFFDELTGSDNLPIIPDLSTDFMDDSSDRLNIIVEEPDSPSERPILKNYTIDVPTIQSFIFSHIFTAVEGLYNQSVSLRSAYDIVFKNLGTPSGGLVPGVDINIESMDTSPVSAIPDLNTLNGFPHTRIDRQYIGPMNLPAFAVNSEGRQVWIGSHLKYKIIRPNKFLLNFAKTGLIYKLPKEFRESFNPKLKHTDRWSWLQGTIPAIPHMHDAAFSFTPIPFNYTFDAVYDFIYNVGKDVDQFMTRTGKLPALSNRSSFGQLITDYVTSQAIMGRDMAAALAGLGFVYQKSGTSWNLVNPDIPTIYGMPTAFMIDKNKVTISKLLKDDNGIVYPVASSKNSDVDRLIFDGSNKNKGIQDVIFVLHKYVPCSRPIRHMLGSLRNGFTLKIPFLDVIYNVLMDSAKEKLKIKFDTEDFRSAIEKALRGEENIPSISFISAFNSVFASFFTQPFDLAGTSVETYYKNTFSKALKLTYEEFCEEYFEKVHGWSNIICAYPHISMSNRYVDYGSTHWNEWLRSYTSLCYADTTLMSNREVITMMTVTPNAMEQLTITDEDDFIKSIDKLSSIDNVYTKEKPLAPQGNATTNEAQILDEIQKSKSLGEGGEFKSTKVDENNSEAIPEAEFKQNITSQTEKVNKTEKVTKQQLSNNKGGSSNDEIVIDSAQVNLKNEEAKFNEEKTNKGEFNDKGQPVVDGAGEVKQIAASLSLDENQLNESLKKIGLGDIDNVSLKEIASLTVNDDEPADITNAKLFIIDALSEAVKKAIEDKKSK